MASSVCVWELFCSLSKYGVCEMSLEWSPDFQPPYICMCMHVYLYYCYYSFPTISLILVFNLKGCFLCREGNEFSPVVGFFIYTSPSEVCKTCFLCSNVCARTRNIFLIPITALPYVGFFFLAVLSFLWVLLLTIINQREWEIVVKRRQVSSWIMDQNNLSLMMIDNSYPYKRWKI